MGFETPLWLLALAAGALPFIAHRIRHRDLRHVTLPTFTLLLAAQASQKRRSGLNDLLLLATRIALLLVLALCLAAPFFQSTVAFGDGAVSDMVVVLDDSMSMRRQARGRSLLAQALERAAEVVGALPQGSRAAIVLAGSPPRTLLETTDDLSAAQRALRSVVAADRGTDLQSAVGVAMQKFEQSRQRKKHLLVLSDFAQHAPLPVEAIQVPGVEVHLERLGGEQAPSNIAILDARAAAAAPGQTSIAVEVLAHGVGSQHATVQQAALAVSNRGSEQMRVPLQFVRGLARATVTVPTPQPGQDPLVELNVTPSDALSQDNRLQVLVGQAGGLRVLLVNGDPHPGSRKDELFYLSRALNLVPPEVGRLRLRSIDLASLDHEDLSHNDVVLFANVPAPPAAVVGRLEAFVTGGGGLIFAAGDRVLPQVYNERLNALLPGYLSSRSQGAPVGFAAGADPQWTVLDGGEGQSGLSQVRTRKRLLVDAAGPPLLRFSDGAAAVLTRQVGRGRVLLLATTIDDSWSDLPIRPGYMPLLTGLIRYAAGDRAVFEDRYDAGETVQVPVPAGASVVEVIAPDGSRRHFEDLEAVLSYTTTQDSGAYRVLAGVRGSPLHFVPQRAFRVERPPIESDIRAINPLPAAAAAGSTDGTTTVERPLAPWLWLLAGLLAILEAGLRGGGHEWLKRWRPRPA